ncbi:hypothetical protein [Gordonia sp. VNK21]|uniref:hypothetical protein n=1 Tax=Gordonia sp. VNK21 TaxID=3382483 RepID=UPI0038D4C12D
MNNWGILAALGLIAAVAAVVAYVRNRQHENASLLRDAELAERLRALASGDPVRLAAVDEFEITVYQRLFYANAVGPRLRSAAWSLLGVALTGAAALLLDGLEGSVAVTLWVVALAAAVVFGVATVIHLVLAAFAAATTPRVSFADSYAAGEDDETD